jgi:hypothetical protein
MKMFRVTSITKWEEELGRLLVRIVEVFEGADCLCARSCRTAGARVKRITNREEELG